jgi:DNA-binding NtrC family response regulator
MVAKPRILVVDDEPVVRESIHDWFSQDEYPIEMAASGPEAMQKMQESSWDILLTDVKMPGMDGLELQQQAKKIDPDITVIIMTAYASVDSAMQAIKEGAYDYVTKPLDPEDLEQIITRAAERRQLVRENIELKERIEAVSGETDEIIGDSPEIQSVRELIETVAPSEAAVLITGESGTGKELVARTLHGASPRRHMPLVTVKLAGLTEDQVERGMFGHEAGVFPGADSLQKGRLELADRGTAFFEEIGDLGPKLQIELQRVLEEKTIIRVGGGEPIPVDFRLIAATSQDLSRAVDRGDFQPELYRQIDGCAIALPPLRERPSDILLLVRYFLEKSSAETGGSTVRISAAAMRLLMDYPWPGNVDELQNVIERAAALQRGDEILPRDLPLGPPEEAARPGALSLAEVEKQHIQKVLDQVSGDVSRAAQVLQIDETTLGDRMREYGLEGSQE